jgi:hypothetical protein
MGESRPGRDRAIPGSLDAHPADAGRRAALHIALAGVPPARSTLNLLSKIRAGKGEACLVFLLYAAFSPVKACARAKRPRSQVAARALTAALRRVFSLHR